MSTGLVTAKIQIRYDWSAAMKMMNCHCGAIPVVEGDTRLIGMVTMPDILLPLSRGLDGSFLRIKNKCYRRLWL
jgi:CBS-domain-containing membrane protein